MRTTAVQRGQRVGRFQTIRGRRVLGGGGRGAGEGSVAAGMLSVTRGQKQVGMQNIQRACQQNDAWGCALQKLIK